MNSLHSLGRCALSVGWLAPHWLVVLSDPMAMDNAIRYMFIQKFWFMLLQLTNDKDKVIDCVHLDDHCTWHEQNVA